MRNQSQYITHFFHDSDDDKYTLDLTRFIQRNIEKKIKENEKKNRQK